MKKLNFYYLTLLPVVLSCCNSPTQTQKEEPELRLLWSFDVTNEPGNNISVVPPLVQEEQVIIRPYGRILSLAKENGTLRWAYVLPEARQTDDSNYLLNDGRTVFGTNNLSGIYYAVDLISGEEKWKIDATDSLTFSGSRGDCVDDRFVFLDDYNKNILAFDKTDGAFSQKYRLDKPPRELLCFDEMLIISMGSFDGSPSNSGEIRAINKQSGELIWEFKTNKGGFFTAPLIEQGGVLYSGTEYSAENTFIALDIKNGSVLWENHTFLTSHFVLAGDTLFINPAGGIVAVAARTGQVLWNYDLGSASESNIEYLNGYVYLPNGHDLLIIDANTGNVVHIFNSPDEAVIWSVKADHDTNSIFLQTSYNLYAYEGWQEQ